MNGVGKYWSRLTRSARGETFNPLIWPALIATFVYGLGFSVFFWIETVGHSSLFEAMVSIHAALPIVWGVVALGTVVIGFTFLLFNIPPAGKVSGLIGFMVWLFAGFCWMLTGGWFVTLAVGVPNMWFWIWQYLSLSHFAGQDREDAATMIRYNEGEYDDDNGGKELRETNRGVERQ